MQILKSRKRFLIYSLLVLILMILAMYILKVFGSYQSNTYLNAEIEKAERNYDLNKAVRAITLFVSDFVQ